MSPLLTAVGCIVLATGLVCVFFRGRRRHIPEDALTTAQLRRVVERHERDQVGRE